MATFLTGAGVVSLIMAVPLVLGLVVGLLLWRVRVAAMLLSLAAWAVLLYASGTMSSSDETNPPAWFNPALASAVFVTPYVFGFLLAVAVRPSPRDRERPRIGA